MSDLKKRALISVSDKTNLKAFAASLVSVGYDIISTGGTYKTLKDAGLNPIKIDDVTAFPEMMDGRLKTLHPKIHGGLLALRDDPEHIKAAEGHEIPPIDLLVCNLYPFEETARSNGNYHDCVENIDIGGPAMIRAAAKNHDSVMVLVEPADYKMFLKEFESNDGCTRSSVRKIFAARAYARTAAYDAEIATWFSEQLNISNPNRIVLSGHSPQILRYGENPHQSGAFYQINKENFGVGTAEQLQGKEVSYNNLNDTDAAFELVAEFDQPTVSIIKHANPCGVASGDNILDACLLYTSPSPRDRTRSRMPSSA